MNLEMLFEVALDDLLQDWLDQGGILMFEDNPNDAALFRHVEHKALFDHAGSGDAVAPAAGFGQQFIGPDDPGHFNRKIEAAEDFQFGVDDILATRVHLLNLRIAPDGSHGFPLQNVAEEQLG